MATELIISPGQTGTLNDTSPPVITFTVAGKAGAIEVEDLQDLQMPMAKEVFTSTQMNKSGKRQFPTTSTNSLTTNIYIIKEQYKGIVADATNVAGSASVLGLFAITKGGVRVHGTWNIGDIMHEADGYITGITPGVSADSPAWVTPITFSIDGDISIVA